MKRFAILIVLAAAISSCGNSNDVKKAEPGKKVEAPKDPQVERGLELVVNSDCLGCHKPEERLQGPSYMEIAKKYAGQSNIEDTLAQRIIKGSVGHWGEIPMIAHPTLSNNDAKAMAQYVLSLNQ